MYLFKDLLWLKGTYGVFESYFAEVILIKEANKLKGEVFGCWRGDIFLDEKFCYKENQFSEAVGEERMFWNLRGKKETRGKKKRKL